MRAGLINLSYIVIPIFMMLRDWNLALNSSFLIEIFSKGFLLNNRLVLALVYASTAMQLFTVYLLTILFINF